MTAPTLYPDVNAVLDALLSSVQDILGDYFVGLYLYGSLASGDFDPLRSDVDFVVVTTDYLPEDLISALGEMHARLWASGLKWAANWKAPTFRGTLCGVMIPMLRRVRASTKGASIWRATAAIGSFSVILREQGVSVSGPPLQPMIDPVSLDEIRARRARTCCAIGGHRCWMTPRFLRDGEYQAYAVLTMCRALYTFHHGAIASKPVSARWALSTLDQRWIALIEWALTWQHADQSDHLSETLDFIRYTLEDSDDDI